METRASHLLVGGFVLVLIAAMVGFIMWLARAQFQETADRYEILFTGSVTGLQVGSAVRYRGVPVGTVREIRLDPDNVERVRVRVDLQPGTPVKTDSLASLEQQGVTGGVYVQITGGTQEARPLREVMNVAIPVIPSKPSTFAELTDRAPELLANLIRLTEQLGGFLSDENRQAFTDILQGLQGVTAGVAGTSSELSGAVSDVRKLVQNLNTFLGAAGGEAEALSTDMKKSSGEFRAAVVAVRQAADSFRSMVAENRQGFKTFSSQGLTELSGLLADFRELLGTLTRLVGRVERDPREFLFGGPSQGVRVRQ
jgi:phospholipid/cholesterol/gamma-HCH transport system substrate-binding protein